MAGQTFVDSAVANVRLKLWVREVAGTRTHGTTRQAPLRLFRDYEQAALLPLPTAPFTLLQIKPVKVHPDCHVTVEGSYYSVPYPYIGHTLDAYVSQQMVELYEAVKLVATHLRCTAPGQMGPATLKVVETLLTEKPLARLRAVQAILGLAQTVGRVRLEAACARALHYDDVRYRRIKQILNAALDRDPLPELPPAQPPRLFTFARASQDFFPAEAEVRPC